ncbi:MAG: FmdB family zinc ribbon protein [Mariniblastus sp.]
MPIYEFICLNCNSEIELLVKSDAKPQCPECQSGKLEKQLSVISSTTSMQQNTVASDCAQPRCCGGGCQPS